MTTTDVVKTQVQRAALAGDQDELTVFDLIERRMPAIEMALPKHLSGERFARIAMTLVRTTPKLLQCEPMSFVGALMVSAQLGLEPGPPLGLSWIIPRKNNRTGKLEANFQFGYKGVIKLFQQSGQFLSIQARAVKENDEFETAYGLDDKLVHKPLLHGDRGQSIAWYAVAKFKDGGHAFVVLDRAEVERRRGRGQDGPAWKTDYDEMAGKTCVLALARWLPLSPELERVLAAEGRTFTEVKADMLQDLPELEPPDVEETTDEAPTVVEEDATGDEAEVEPAEVPSPDGWSAEQWKAYAKDHGVSQADLIRHAESLRGEFHLEGTPVTSLGHLKGQARLCELLAGWVEEQTNG